MHELYLQRNQFSGAIPDEITNLTLMHRFYIQNNQLSDLPDLSSMPALQHLLIHNNQFTFEDIEPNIEVANFSYSPQDSVGTREDRTLTGGENFEISVSVGGTANQYQWMKDGVDLPGVTSSTFTFHSVNASHSGSYSCRITNTIATELTLYSRPINLTVIGEGEPAILDVPMADVSPVIDGEMDNIWYSVTTVVMEKASLDADVPPDNWLDCYASFKMMVDMDNYYLFIQAHDDEIKRFGPE